MKKYNKHDWIIFGLLILAFLILVAFVRAATTPVTGIESNYGILSSTYTDTSSATTINGDVGFTTPPATAPLGVHTNYGSGSPYSLAGTAQATLLSSLNSQTCDFTIGSAQDLSLLTQPLTPGVYCISGAQSIGTGGITLTSGTYIFRSTGALNTVANSVVSGGNSCDIFWTPVATTLGANSTFKGTVIDDAGITVGAVTNWEGRALSFGGTVTTDTDMITVPSCTIATTTPPMSTTTPVITTSGINGPIAGSYGVSNIQHIITPIIVTTTIPTSTSITSAVKSIPISVCDTITDLIVVPGGIGSGRIDLFWKGGGTYVTIFYGGSVLDKSTTTTNVFSYTFTDLKRGHWNFQVTNTCSQSQIIDPLI